MKHRFNKAKFGKGQDANEMLLKKLASNFFMAGKLETTKQKAKAAQSAVERMVTKAKGKTEADKNYILRNITNTKVMDVLMNQIAGQLANVKSGYTRIVRLGKRLTDGADLARLEWAYPVVLAEKKTEVKPKASKTVKKETKKEEVKTAPAKAEDVKEDKS